jgi:nucleotide-binding universal stress UspA family protein
MLNNSILVPLDGSAFAECALPVAMDLARRMGARLHLVQVIEPLWAPVDPVGLPDFSDWERAAQLRSEEYLQSTASRCMEQAGVSVRTERLDGPTATAIAMYAAEVDIGMIVMTTHGRGGLNRVWMGSVADALVRRVRVPILLLRPRPGESAEQPLGLRHIVVPIDGSDLSTRAIERAVELGTPFGARYTLLRVVLPNPLVPMPLVYPRKDQMELVARERSTAFAQLESEATLLRARGFDVQTIVVEGHSPAMAILQFAFEHDVDMIALATHGRGGWSRMALGSVADKVMRGSTIPILLYRPGVAVTAEPPKSLSASEVVAGPPARAS